MWDVYDCPFMKLHVDLPENSNALDMASGHPLVECGVFVENLERL